jgi:hypothetical protein
MANNELKMQFEEGAVYLYVEPGVEPNLLICVKNVFGIRDENTGKRLMLKGCFFDIDPMWDEFGDFELYKPNDGLFYKEFLRKIAPSVQALVEQVVPFSFGV